MSDQTINTEAGIQAAAQATGTEDVTQTPPASLGEGIEIKEPPAIEDPNKEDPNKEVGVKPDEKEGDEKKDDKEQGKDKELFGKPKTYDYKDVKLPENMVLDEAMTGKFNEYAAKLNLSQKGANDLMAMAVELTEQTQQQTLAAMGKLQEAKIEGFKQLLNTDKEVGGANLKQSIETANLAYDAFFKDEDLRVMLAEGGLNVHPKFIKALKAIGSQMKNDTIHTGSGAAKEKREREDILYPSMDNNK